MNFKHIISYFTESGHLVRRSDYSKVRELYWSFFKKTGREWEEINCDDGTCWLMLPIMELGLCKCAHFSELSVLVYAFIVCKCHFKNGTFKNWATINDALIVLIAIVNYLKGFKR